MNKSKSSLFLMELILAILVFALSSAVCVKIFVKANVLSHSTETLNRAVTLCANAAELFYGYKGDLVKISENMDEARLGECGSEQVVIYYDQKFSVCEKDESAYRLTATSSMKGGLKEAVISLTEGEETVYSLNCSLYLE